MGFAKTWAVGELGFAQPFLEQANPGVHIGETEADFEVPSPFDRGVHPTRVVGGRKAKPLKGFEAFQESGDQNVLGVIDAVVGLHSFLEERVCFVE